MILSLSFERLVQALSRFPGIGKKTAQRLAWFLVAQNKSFALELSETILSTVNSFKACSTCNMLSESDPCPICSSEERHDRQLCVVETPADVFILENLHEYQGKYFVLGHLLSPLDGHGPAEIHAPQLMQRLAQTPPEELVLALKPSSEGEATIHYLSDLLSTSGIRITRLSTGIPFGGDLEYSSQSTLANAFKRRFPV